MKPKEGDVVTDIYAPNNQWRLIKHNGELRFQYIGPGYGSYEKGYIFNMPYDGRDLGDNWELVINKSGNFRNLYDKLSS